MFATLYQSGDLVSVSFATATLATFACAALVFLGLSWTAERWRLALALSGVALLASALHYLDAASLWFAKHEMSAALRYTGWFVVHPLEVAAVYFFARSVGAAPAGIFWRLVVAAILMVFCRFLGDARIFNPTLGVLLSMAFWLYILGELFFGALAHAVGKASRAVRLGYFWIRLIMTIGWAIYPILHFVDVVIGTGHTPAIIVLYTLADFVNLIVVAMIVLAVAGQERA